MSLMRKNLLSDPEKKKSIYSDPERSRKLSESVKKYGVNPEHKEELRSRWTPERRERQREVMKMVRASYHSNPENRRRWRDKVAAAAKLAGNKMIGRKRPECGHASWNTGLTKETSAKVANIAAKCSRPRSKEACKNIAAACADRKNKNPEWYKKICAINRKNAVARKGVPRSVEFMRKLLNAKKPTSIEIQFMNLVKKNNLPYRYVGDGKFWIGNKNPDFIHTDRSKREVIELYGDYWHRGHNPQDRIDLFAKSNFKCTVIWEREFKRDDWEERVLEAINV